MKRIACFLIACTLVGCGKPPASQQDLASLDSELTRGTAPGNQRDPTLTAALRDQIMVDPKLAQTSNANAIRPAPRPDPLSIPPHAPARADGVDPATLKRTPAAGADCPSCRAADGALTLGELATRQRATAACAPKVAYSATWSTRLPAGVALYPDARVAEAAGTDAPGCALRVVSFTSNAPATRVLDWYYTRLTGAGYSAEHQARDGEHVLGGTRGGAAYVIYVTPRVGGGTDVDLIAN